ncbi:TVP38/TMEM64 family protein [Anoxynatronum sibiricum]|uniref:TVP38/TMEM64 family membrane protein n=1 Tax=Anoxynatronum sibiricum TaxID=210623 RepID=A0ABU9VSP0_9CLOT
MNRKRVLILLVAAAALGIYLTAADSLVAWIAFFRPDDIQELVRHYGFWGKLLFFGLAAIRPFLFMPVSVFFITGGIAFGTLQGSALAIGGLVISSSLCYWLAHRFQCLFYKIVHEKYIRKVQEAAATNLVSKTFSLRVSPGMPFDIISYAAGLTNISYRKFIWGTFLGAIPKGVLYTYLADNLDNYFSPQTITAYSLLLAIALGPHLYHWVQKKRRPKEAGTKENGTKENEVPVPPWKPPDC